MAGKDLTFSRIAAGLRDAGAGLKRHAGIIFVIAILAAVVYSVSAVNIVLNTPTDVGYRLQKQSEVTSTQFDKKTIGQIESLGDRNNPPAPVLPGGRINPFVE